MENVQVLRIEAPAATDVLFVPPQPLQSKKLKFPRLGHAIPFKVRNSVEMTAQMAEIRALGKVDDDRGNIGLVISTSAENVTRELFGNDLYETDVMVREAVENKIPEEAKEETVFIVGAVRLNVHRVTVEQFLGFLEVIRQKGA